MTRHPAARSLFVLLVAMLTLSAIPTSIVSAAAPANAWFNTTWQRTDQPVTNLDVARTWVWGPEAITAAVGEPYAEAPGGTRMVQYFEKSRMEINQPDGDASTIWYVTNGLLAREMITGQLQVGDNAFQSLPPADINIAGDSHDAAAPTYASFRQRLNDPPLAANAAITQTLDRSGNVGCCAPAVHGVVAADLVPETNHRVASVFLEYLNSAGRIIERDRRTTGRLFANPYYATGFPIGEAYWSEMSVANVRQWVLVQPFERRVLTYTPANPAGWRVEMGNVGAHSLAWRYRGTPLPPPPRWILPEQADWVPFGQAVEIPDLKANYNLHITGANVDTGQVDVNQTITIERFHTVRPQRLYLQSVPGHYGWMDLRSLTIAGQPVTPEVRQGGLIYAVDLPANAATPLTIEMSYRLHVGREASGWGGTSLADGILRLGYWFPIISDDHAYSSTFDPSQSQVASFDVIVDVPGDVVVAHAGEQVSRETLGNGLQRYRLHAGALRDFALVLSRGFQVTERTMANGVVLRYYHHPVTGQTSQINVALNAAEDAINKLSGLIGPYIWSTYVIVDVGPSMPGGLEFPGLAYVNGRYYDMAALVYHETAHMWLYAMLGNRTVIDGWIDEGGAEFFERGLPSGFTDIPQPPPGGYQFPIDATAAELPDDASRQWYYSVYEQGARFYYEMKGQMGNDAFWDAWRDLYRRYLNRIMTPAQVLSTFQEHSSTDLRPLFERYFRYDWVWEILPPGR